MHQRVKPRHTIAAIALAAALAAPAPPAGAQNAGPAARAADVASIDAIMAAVYDAISGPAGQARNRERFLSLFHPQARLIPTNRVADGGRVARALTPEEYITRSGPVLERDGFFEVEIARCIEQYGSIAHVFSTYESRRTLQDEKPFARGINSFQLFHDGTRWWVVTIFWEGESADRPIPSKYLPGGRGGTEPPC